MRRSDIVQWYKERKLPVPEKSACVFCPYHSDAAWARMKDKWPSDFAAAVRVDEAIRNDPSSRIKGMCYYIAVFVHFLK